MAKPLGSALWRLGISFPAPELDFIRYVCMVDGRRAREELGFGHASHTLKETIRAIDREANGATVDREPG